jgi:hypothetical protein
MTPPDKEMGSNTAVRRPASPWMVASAMGIRGSCVREWLLIWICLGASVVCVCVSFLVCVCVCFVFPRVPTRPLPPEEAYNE